MGRQSQEIRVVASLSRYNSPQDDKDDALWDELKEAIERVVNQKKYDSIGPMVC